MKARIQKVYNSKNPENDTWTVMIQRKKGEPYDIGLLKEKDKPYYTSDKNEAIRQVKEVNAELRNRILL